MVRWDRCSDSNAGTPTRSRAPRRRRPLLLATVVGIVAALGVPLAGSATAATTHATAAANTVVPLGAIGFGSILVDSTNGHVFVSGPTANVVDVFDLAGNLVTSIPNQYGAWGMVVHGSTLYVVQSTTGTIEKIGLTTFTDEGPLASGLVQVRWVVFAGGQLWTNVSLPSGYALTSVSLAGTVTSFPDTGAVGGDLATSPALPNTLFIAEDGSSPGAVFRLDVTTGTPTLTVSNTFTHQENIEQLAVSPDGTRVIPASGAPYDFEELSAATLQPDGIVYPGQPYPSAVAVSPGDGGVLATGLDNGYSSPDVEVHQLGKPTPIFTATTNPANGTADVLPHGLAMTDDGSMLYVITADDLFQTMPSLNVFTIGPPKPVIIPTTTSLSATPAQPQFGSTVTVTATVTPAAPGAAQPTGTVTFSINGSATPIVTLPLVNGSASFTTQAFPAGATHVVATYSGDSMFAASISPGLADIVGCSNIVTGTHRGTIVVTSGSVCLLGARVYGSVIVANGASADIEHAKITGAVIAVGTQVLRMCSTVTTGAVLVARATGLTVIGDPGDAACPPNTIGGVLVLGNNSGGVEAIGNSVARLLAANNTGPGPYPGDSTTITGNRVR